MVNKNERIHKMSFLIKGIVIAAIAVIFILALLYLVHPQFFSSAAHTASRVKNTFSHYVLNEKPNFYYLVMEKNGKDINVSTEEALEVTYRDEFVVKSIVSDDLRGKYTTVKFEGFSSRDNDAGVLLKGIDFVNKIIQKGEAIGSDGVVSDYKIAVNYGREKIGSVPLKITVTPQDWFRFAKESSNVNEQIEYLKKAILLNQNDVSVRKILGGIYLRLEKLDDAIIQYRDVLKVKPDDTTAMLVLAKCYIKKKDMDDAAKVSKEIIRINPKDAEAYLIFGLSREGKGLWTEAARNYREAVRLEPDNYQARLKLGQALKNSNMI
ncbi:MAG: tetratricopeptide repeat protein, partial [Smithella sp.]